MNVLSDPAPRWELLATVLVFLLTASAAAQTPPPRDPTRPPEAPTRDRAPVRTTGTGVIKGRVVDGVTAAPIARARVRMMGGPNARGPVLTDGEGNFAFTGLVPGSIQVMVDKSTYLSGRHPDQARTLRGRFTPSTIADGQVMEVTIKMFHGGVIAGRVTDSYGDPVDYATVQLMALPRGRAPTNSSGGSTNDLGEFRLARLLPGRYVLSVTPRSQMMEEPLATSVTPLPQPTPVYYPAAPSQEQSQAIVLNRGETVSGIEIVLGEGMPTVLQGMVIGPETVINRPGTYGNVSARAATSGPNFGPPVANAQIRADGTFRMPLVPGQYILDARMNPQVAPGEAYQPNRELAGMAQVTIGGGQTESVTIMLGKGATASGRIVFDGSSNLQIPPAPVGRPMRPPITSEDPGGCRTGEAAIAADWTFKIDGLIGTCSAVATNIYGRWTLKAVRIGGVNALEKPVTFDQGRHYNDVEIVVTDKPTQVELRVTGDDGQLTREYVALAFPQDKTLWKQGPRVIRNVVPRTGPMPANIPPALAGRLPTGPQARDLIPGLTAGEYYVISLDDIDAEDAFDPAVLEKLASHATRVTVTGESTSELTLPRLKITDIIR
jgi:hypothetical protein